MKSDEDDREDEGPASCPRHTKADTCSTFLGVSALIGGLSRASEEREVTPLRS